MLTLLTDLWPLTWSVGVFLVATAVTVVCSIRLAGLGDTLADRTGWGEALFGAVLFGLVTSLSGIVMTAVSAASDQPRLAYSNAVGGIAAQTVALVVADAFLRKVNLEHAAASVSNMLFGCLLIGLLGIALMATFSPSVTFLSLHPASVVLVAFYLGALVLIRSRGEPMWQAVRTRFPMSRTQTSKGLLLTRHRGCGANSQRRLGRVLPVLLDFLTAAGLIRLAADVSWGSILAAAAVIAVRKIAALGVQAGQGIGKRV